MKIAPPMAARIVYYVIASAFFIVNSYALSEHDHSTPIQFTYTGEKGTDKWGSLNRDFHACTTGKSQSPINIVKDNIIVEKHFKPLTGEYYSSPGTLANHGFNVGIRYGNNSGFMDIDGKIYSLKQVHWHSPSEHRIDGVQYAAELHMVHVAEDGSHAVVAMLYEYGPADPLLNKIKKNLIELAEKIGDQENRITLGAMNVKQLRKTARKYYRYNGSLTTPPCTEHVIWHILGKVRTISKEQVEALKAPLDPGYKNNARPAQPLNGRKVELYEKINH